MPFGPNDSCTAQRDRNAAPRNRQQARRNQAQCGPEVLSSLRGLSEEQGCAAGAQPLGAAQELYAPQTAAAELDVCCDRRCGCRSYLRAQRSRFWPSYCHPRWLSCDELYCRR